MHPGFNFITFSRGQHDDDNISRRPGKRERSISTHHLNNFSPNEEDDLADCLLLLSNSGDANKHGHCKGKTVKKQKTAHAFQCKACKKVFASHQALGGHRASHKKVKGCFASQDKEEEEEEEEYKEDEDEEDEEEDDEEDEEDKSTTHITRKRSNTHECTICHRVFSSGQALGGHKRCHWLTPSTYIRMPPQNSSIDYHHQLDQPSLDLNLACQEYSVDPTVLNVELIGRNDSGNNQNASGSSSWLKLGSDDWS